MRLKFTWNAGKAAINAAKHHVSFETAARVFLDPFALTEQDRIEGGQYRWQTLGSVEGGVVLLVAHISIDEEGGIETIHIISARRAVRSERKRYENEKIGRLRT